MYANLMTGNAWCVLIVRTVLFVGVSPSPRVNVMAGHFMRTRVGTDPR